jgi:hypothetical protein
VRPRGVCEHHCADGCGFILARFLLAAIPALLGAPFLAEGDEPQRLTHLMCQNLQMGVGGQKLAVDLGEKPVFPDLIRSGKFSMISFFSIFSQVSFCKEDFCRNFLVLSSARSWW